MPNSATTTTLLNPVVALASEASSLILTYYNRQDFKVMTKADDSPVTEADLKASELLVAGLKKLTPSVPVISEELGLSPEEMLAVIKGAQQVWLVDPLDGTRDFVARTGDFTVNVALVSDGQPVLGVVAVPARGSVYFAAKDAGAFVRKDSGRKDSGQKNGEEPKPITTRPVPPQGPTVLVSRHHRQGEADEIRQRWPGCEIVETGSALKYCLIAAGEADLSLRRTPTSLWDTAAAQCVLEVAGGRMVDFAGEPLSYTGERLVNPGFVAYGDSSSSWRQWVLPAAGEGRD